MFGGNSNWRGPVWMPVNALIVRALLNLYALLRRRLHGRVPDRLGHRMTLFEVAQEIVRPADRARSCATRTGGVRSTAARRSSRTIRTGATSSSSTSTSTATTAPASERAIRRDGPPWSRPCWTCSAGSTQRPCSRSSAPASWPGSFGNRSAESRRERVEERPCPIHATRRFTRSTPASG